MGERREIMLRALRDARANGPAWFGLETAHHGPDAGDPGRGDGCYQIEGRLSPLDPASDRNPGIE